MDSRFDVLPNSFRPFASNDEAVLYPNSHQFSRFTGGYTVRDSPLGLGLDLDVDLDLSSFMDLPPFAPPLSDDHDPASPAAPSSISTSPETGFPDNDSDDFEETVYKYIGHMLMEEEMEERAGMFPDPLALQAAEKSFYDVLSGDEVGQPSSYRPASAQTPDNFWRNSDSTSSPNSGSCSLESADGQIGEPEQVGFDPYLLQFQVPPVLPYNCGFGYAAAAAAQMPTVSHPLLFTYPVIGRDVSNPSPCEWESFLSRGLEQASSSRLIPSANGFIVGSGKHEVPPGSWWPYDPDVLAKFENSEEYRTNSKRGGIVKSHVRDDESDIEERSGKQLAVCVEEDELSEMFDRVLLCPSRRKSDERNATLHSQKGTSRFSGQGLQALKFHVGCNGVSIQERVSSGVDLKNRLLGCARAISSDDRRTAVDLLGQIRQNSSPFGDGYERFAHYCANALEARMDGTGPKSYSDWVSKKKSTVDILKAHQLYLSNCPFTRFAIFFANHHILSLSEKAETLHIIDFGILYGFQWPIVIQRLADRAGGPPKLRITGIELPQPGFRPEERVKGTGRRLAKYCERFNVPFEFNAIAQKWESLRIEDLNLRKDETVAVNCLNRFENLLDETVIVNSPSPRAAVLNLVRNIKPDIFVHSVVHGSINAPFFATRFREACFHFAALYDMFDATIPRENPDRMMFEREFYGRDALNVIACEGSERIERPETYKKWHVRNLNAGFRKVPLNKELVKKVKSMVKAGYHKDFVVDQDDHWLLLGWRGRIFNASSCWVPAVLS